MLKLLRIMKILNKSMHLKSFYLMLIVALITGMAIVSCVEDTDPVGTDVKFGLTLKDKEGVEYDTPIPENFVDSFPKKGGSRYFYMESNIGAWRLVPDAGRENSVEIWPNEGKNDGRFGVKILENPTAYELNFNINVVNSAGQVMGRIPFNQEPSDPFLKINYSSSPKFVASIGEKFPVKVSANIAWEAVSNDDWLTIAEATDSTQMILVDKNEGVQRSGSITFSMIGEDESLTMFITQLDLANDFANATKVSIKNLMSEIDENDGIGTINDNVYIEGYVISDRSRLALKKTQIVVQDDSNKGVWIEFSNDDDNTFDLNDHVKVHMYGASFVLDENTKASKAVSFSPSFVHEATPSAGITPIEITDLVNLNQYENVLVTLKEVEFVLPVGTYVNIAEAEYNKKAANWTSTAEPYSDDTFDYGHLVRDRKGNFMKMYTSPSFLDRFKVTMPQGSGSLTGIMMKRVKNNKVQHIIRIRNHEDNQVSTDKATALSRDIMQIGPWPIRLAYPVVSASVGSGTLGFTGRPNQNVATASTPDAFYFVSSQARMKPYDLNPDGTPVVGYSNDLSYWGLNTQYWWGNPSSSISGGSSGEAWIITTSTLNATGAGDLYLQFSSSSSTSGPAYFTLEWADSEDTPFANWNYVDEYVVCDFNNSQHLMHYIFKMPDAIKGKSKVVIRLRVNSQKRATQTSNIGNSGTNRLGVVRLTQQK